MLYPLNHFVDFYFCERRVRADGFVEKISQGCEKIMCSVKPNGHLIAQKTSLPNTAAAPLNHRLQQRFELVCRHRQFPFEIDSIVWNKRTFTPLGEPENLHKDARIRTVDFLRLHIVLDKEPL